MYDVLEYLASGMTHTEILREFPYLTEAAIRACLAYAADRERWLEIFSATGFSTQIVEVRILNTGFRPRRIELPRRYSSSPACQCASGLLRRVLAVV